MEEGCTFFVVVACDLCLRDLLEVCTVVLFLLGVRQLARERHSFDRVTV